MSPSEDTATIVDLSPDWETLAAEGSLDELIAWGQTSHHIDLADDDVALSLAANAILTGAWRNNSELEAIHVGDHKRRGQPKAGLSDAEMMVGNIETAKTIRQHLASWDEYWYFDLVDELFDSARPYAGIPLGEHVTKVSIKSHRRQVDKNLYLFHMVADLVGRDRFLRGLALAGAEHEFWGSPLWPDQVDAWAEGDLGGDRKIDRSSITPEIVATMKADPTRLDIAVLEDAIYRTGIGFARGRQRWHAHHCGVPNHQPDRDLTLFLDPMWSDLMGIPATWVAALGARKQAQGT